MATFQLFFQSGRDKDLSAPLYIQHQVYVIHVLWLLGRQPQHMYDIPDPTENQLKGRHFPSDAEVIAAGETWLDGQHSEFFF